MSFELLNAEIISGIEGKNGGIPMGFDRLNRYIGIRKRIYTLVFGASGSGKSAYVHSAYILQPFDWWIKSKKDINLKIVLFSMERSKVYILAKWMSRKIFIDQGILIPIQRILGWWDLKLSKDEHDLILMFKGYMEELLETVDIIEGAQNPTAIYKYMKGYAEKNGKFEEEGEFKKIYIPNHPNEIVIPIVDHVGISKLEKGMSFKKEAVDKLSEYYQYFRDTLGYSPIAVSQITRNLGNVMYQKMESFEPTIDDIKESGRPGEDSDAVISLFDPKRYNTNDKSYGDVDKFVDGKTGGKYFRSVKILKNTYGEDDLRVGMAFMGSTGIFKELPKVKDMEGFDYESLFNNSYFIQ